MESESKVKVEEKSVVITNTQGEGSSLEVKEEEQITRDGKKSLDVNEISQHVVKAGGITSDTASEPTAAFSESKFSKTLKVPCTT